MQARPAAKLRRCGCRRFTLLLQTVALCRTGSPDLVLIRTGKHPEVNVLQTTALTNTGFRDFLLGGDNKYARAAVGIEVPRSS